MYNKIKSEQIKISEARSNIGVYLQQRYDEITAMYKIVQEYKLHEISTFKEIVQLRQMAMNDGISFKEQTEINNEIEGRLPTLMATFENYPELRSNENFLQLQEAISDNESNISSARKSYNGYINKYNTTIAMFPTMIFAKMFNFVTEELYETPENKRENPLL
jgi:LemA protein